MADSFIQDRKAEVGKDKIVVYIKGTPEVPQCGFSAQVVDVFKGLGKPFTAINILENPTLRARMHEFSNWPTFPQIFINGKFIGGCDIVTEMHQQGELAPLVEAAFKR